MNTLTLLDYVIIVASLGFFLVIGVLVSKLASKSLEHYFLGGRNLSWWMLGLLGMNTWFDLTGTMIITSFVYLFGINGFFIELRGGVVLPLAFVMVFTGKWFRRSGCMTGAEWITFRFGTGRAAEFLRLVTAIMLIVSSLLGFVYLIRGTLLFMGAVFPVDPMTMVIVILVISSIYTVLGGFYASVVTDVAYSVAMVAGCVILGFVAWRTVPDIGVLSAAAEAATNNPQWASSLPKWKAYAPPDYKAYEYILIAAVFYMLRNIIGGAASGAEQRVFAARTPREASIQCLVGEVGLMFRWPLIVSFAILGIFLVNKYFPEQKKLPEVAAVVRAAYPNITDASWHSVTSSIAHHPESADPEMIRQLESFLGKEWRSSLLLVGPRGTVNPEMLLPAVIMGQFGPGVRGFIVVVLLSALMGSVSSGVNGAASYFVRDIYQNFLRSRAGNRELMAASYGFSVLVLVAGIFLGSRVSSINNIWSWIIMGFGAGSLMPFLLRLYWWRSNAWGIAFGIFVGMFAAIAQRIVSPGMSEFFQLALVTGCSAGATILGSLMTQPTNFAIVRRFYRRTRPFGLWKPFLSELEGEIQRQWKREHRNDIVAVCIAIAWQICLFLMPMQLITHNWPALQFTGMAFLAGSVGLYFFWWKNLPSPEEKVPDFAFVPPEEDDRPD
jgi:SSS family solute:Na+ symporter